MSRERILFVTGRLAEFSLRNVVDKLSKQVGFEYEMVVLGISVAALMHADWVVRKLEVDSKFDRIILPGWCSGNLQSLSAHFGTKVEQGPIDLYDLPEFFGQQGKQIPDLNEYDIEILAEINHAPQMTDAEILRLAESYRTSGANVIDLGCIPGQSWQRVGEVTRMLRDQGFRISIDSFDRTEVEAAVHNGAELVLSCNSGNLDWAAKLDTELVAIPDDPHDLSSLEQTVEELQNRDVRFRIDPIIEPIGFGFAASLARYFEVRRKWPDIEIMMGVGNLSELSDVDSAGVNFLLAGICQEVGIRSLLTTEVINWACSAVRELDVARRMMFYCVNQKVLPKHLDSRLIMLRDPKLRELGAEALDRLAGELKDPNFRIFVERGEIHIMNRNGYWRGTDPYELFDRMKDSLENSDPSHTFYLGYELSKAVTALTLRKQYTQDEALRWGFLTVQEKSAVERHRNKGIERGES